MIISKILSKIDISNLRFRRSPEKEKEKPSLIKEVIDEPEKFKLEAFIEGNEIIVKSRNERLSPEQGLFLFFLRIFSRLFYGNLYIFKGEEIMCKRIRKYIRKLIRSNQKHLRTSCALLHCLVLECLQRSFRMIGHSLYLLHFWQYHYSWLKRIIFMVEQEGLRQNTKSLSFFFCFAKFTNCFMKKRLAER